MGGLQSHGDPSGARERPAAQVPFGATVGGVRLLELADFARPGGGHPRQSQFLLPPGPGSGQRRPVAPDLLERYRQHRPR